MSEKLTGLSHIKLAIATPFYEIKGYSPYIVSLARTIEFLLKYTDVDFSPERDYWEHSGDSYPDRARNALADKFLKSDRTHMFFIDSDHQWEVEGFMRVLLSPGEIVGAGYPCKNVWSFFGCILNTLPDGRPRVTPDGLISAWIVPAGFMRIERGVFEKMKEMVDFNKHVNPETGVVQDVFDFYSRIQPYGEDSSFCLRAEKAGILRWVQPNVTITHYGVKGWRGNYHEEMMGWPGGSKGPPMEEEGNGEDNKGEIPDGRAEAGEDEEVGGVALPSDGEAAIL